MDDVLRFDSQSVPQQPPRRQRRVTPTEPKADIISEPNADPYPLTEVGDSEYFAAIERGKLKFDHARRAWWTFGTHHWKPDTTGATIQRAIESMRLRQAAAMREPDSERRRKRGAWALAGESDSRLRHLLDIARTHPDLATDGEQWDTEPMILGVENGIVDLAAGTLRAGSPADMTTRVAPHAFTPDAPCPRWEQFVQEISDDDLDLAAYLSRCLGYIITGRTTEQVFFVLFGRGANGKSTLLETLTRHVLPHHGWTMPFPTTAWSESMSEYQRAELVGRRVVVAVESEQAQRLNTTFLKSLTGTDSVNARHPYGRPFTFRPVAKIMLACNHLPRIDDESHGMWRRVRLVPFRRQFDIDTTLGDTLAAEAPGILRWLVTQCLEWQAHGLGLPVAVETATADYHRQSDRLGSFLADACIVADTASVRAGHAFDAYRTWCDAQRMCEADRIGSRTFGELMKAKFKASERAPYVTYYGVGLRHEEVAR